MTCIGALVSKASSIDTIVAEPVTSRVSERRGRLMTACQPRPWKIGREKANSDFQLNPMKMRKPIEMEPKTAFLFVRSQTDLDLALYQVNGLLAFRRNRHQGGGDDKILAVCFHRDLDSRLPQLRPSTEDTGSRDFSPAIYESVSLSGIWTLSWIRGLALHCVRNSLKQREVIFGEFVDLLSERNSLGSLCPVFGRDESPDSIAIEMARLQERHPLLIDPIRFRQDSSHGLYCEGAIFNRSCMCQ